MYLMILEFDRITHSRNVKSEKIMCKTDEFVFVYRIIEAERSQTLYTVSLSVRLELIYSNSSFKKSL